MARIIYGVAGEGSGHSSRAREMARHLIDQGHSVKIVSYDRGYRSLSTDFDCVEVDGLHIISHENRVSGLRTVLFNLKRAPALLRSIRKVAQLFTEFKPDCVLTDFEPYCAWLAKRRKIPVISLDNQHRMRYMEYSVPKSMLWGKWSTRWLIQAMIPAPTFSLVTTFFKGKVTNDRTYLFDAILRREVIALQPHIGDFHLVYVTQHYAALLDSIKQFPEQKFVIYGYNRNAQEGNLQFKEFSSDGFLQDLATCQSVIATAGFTLISEAMYLGKPYLAFPIRGQFEQQLNALCLEELGFGVNATHADKHTLADFVQRLPTITSNLSAYRDSNANSDRGCGNKQVKKELDRLLGELP